MIKGCRKSNKEISWYNNRHEAIIMDHRKNIMTMRFTLVFQITDRDRGKKNLSKKIKNLTTT